MREPQGRRVDWLVWCLSNLISNHYIYLMKQKFNGFVINKAVKDIHQMTIMKARDILSTHITSSTYPGGNWKVKYLSSNYLYEVDRSYSKFTCYLYPLGLRETFTSINVPSYCKIPMFFNIFFWSL